MDKTKTQIIYGHERPKTRAEQTQWEVFKQGLRGEEAGVPLKIIREVVNDDCGYSYSDLKKLYKR